MNDTTWITQKMYKTSQSGEWQVHVEEVEVADEECKLDLKEAESLLENVDDLIEDCLIEFPESDEGPTDDTALYAAKITKASIIDHTWQGHKRTPRDITAFIIKKCGPVNNGFEGRKMAYLYTWLMLFCIDEVINLKFGSFNIIMGECSYVDIKLKTCKSAQTGVQHGWWLHATVQCPYSVVRALSPQDQCLRCRASKLANHECYAKP
ncbi:hypothetical protein EW146_g4044 [Bondarzewia mesenterica]|uniref:Uncharacterized protein n=1 Tax=Bondarzewia mesenterica TaxID=1095465 RepID=A0A4S4LVW3_9AGAM|nr:hypothetical protein EW146_g4044 [Bondarzewia mesenterica]